MNLADRLRGVVRRQGSAEAGYTSAAPANIDGIAEVLGGEWRDVGGHRYVVIDTCYSPGHHHGRVAVGDCLPPDDGIWRRLPLLEPAITPGRLLFVDLETTGLAGGAGTYAFLVGCGWFDGAGFRVRQFFLASHTAERALLEGVAEAAGAATGVVTYNGKTFDLPLIETRFLFHRMATPFAGVPHVDMLHPARRLWKDDCRLSAVEQTLLGHVRGCDVPGFEIPSRYFHYVRTSDARPLHAVVEHNRLDLLALAMLTARAAQLLEGGPAATRTPGEALGLGRLYERRGLITEARACYAWAAGLDAVGATHASPLQAGPHDLIVQAEALRGYAVLCRRERLYEEASAAWRSVLNLRRCPPHIAREATEALAVHLEHRARDLPGARRYALQSLQFNITVTRTHAVRHRLARLDRKIGQAPDLVQLF